eukprot:COSAG06_NODE_19270_length_845_cov_7.907507_2_plen_48_part_01
MAHNYRVPHTCPAPIKSPRRRLRTLSLCGLSGRSARCRALLVLRLSRS